MGSVTKPDKSDTAPAWVNQIRNLAADAYPRLAQSAQGSARAWLDRLNESAAPSRLRVSEIPAELFQADDTETRTLAIRPDRAADATVPAPGAALPSQTLFSDLASCWNKLPAELRPFLGCPSAFETDALAQLVVSRAAHGAVIHVPAGVQVRLPLRTLTWLDAAAPALFHRTVLVAEPGSEVVYIDELTGSESPAEEGEPRAVAGLIQILARRGSRVHYYQVQNWPLNVQAGLRTSITVEKDAQVDCVTVTLGAGQADSRLEAVCAGSGASLKIVAAARGDDAQKFAFSVTTRHIVPDTTSAFDLLTVMADKAKAVFNGMISITPVALRTDAYQKNRNMILSPQASVETNPKLEIATDEVKCAHGASVAPVSFDQLYYLQSRGISALDAELMIINGFTDPVIQRLPEASGVRRRVMEALESKHAVHPCGVVPTLQETQA